MAQAQDRKIARAAGQRRNAGFWDAAGRKTADQEMHRVRRAHFYPRNICPFCFSDQTEWQRDLGQRHDLHLHAMRRAPVPYAIAYVTLAEGPP